MSGHFLKLHFCTFERSQMKHNNLDCHKLFWNNFAKFTYSYLNKNKKCFCMFKAFKLQEWIIFIFLKYHFFTNCAPFLSKIGEDFNIDD